MQLQSFHSSCFEPAYLFPFAFLSAIFLSPVYLSSDLLSSYLPVSRLPFLPVHTHYPCPVASDLYSALSRHLRAFITHLSSQAHPQATCSGQADHASGSPLDRRTFNLYFATVESSFATTFASIPPSDHANCCALESNLSQQRDDRLVRNALTFVSACHSTSRAIWTFIAIAPCLMPLLDCWTSR